MEYSNTVILRKIKFFLATALVATALLGCDGDDGERGKTGATGATGGSPLPTASSAESLNISIDSVTIGSPPVVELSVSDEDGIPLTGISGGDLRFTFAKLVPSMGGDPSYWQSYINREETATVGPGAGNTTVQATSERNGTLVDHGDGTYTYTFATDVANVTTPLAVSYDPTLTHRVAIQVGGGLPVTNPTFTFRPSDGMTTGIVTRDIVKIESCNECHNTLALHGGGRVDTLLCVTCHNPGSTDANSGNTVDFKVMIHKIHRGEDLPSVVAGGEYSIYGFRDTKHDFSDVALPQNIRHCTKCHDGSDPDTPEGDNWKTQFSMIACGSCHDDIDFSKDGSGSPPVDPTGHPGGIVSDNSECITCHATGRIARSVEEAHILAGPVARTKFKLNILEICGTLVDTDPGPICAPGDNPTVKFSITDPTNGDAEYDLNTTPEITGSSVSFLVAWDTDDYNNTDGTGTRPARADSIDFDEPGFVDDGFKRTVTASFIIPDGTGATGFTASGSGAVGAQGRLVGDFDGDGIFNENEAGKERERIFVKSEVEFFRIDDATVVARRPTVENAKCNQCHDQVSFHGGSRSGEYGVCVLCHNPNNTDIARRPVPPDPLLDGKTEEAIDFKRLIHGIHSGAQTQYDGSDGHGFREKGLVVYGFGNRAHDYSHMRFPGILQDCETCHEPGAYALDGTWASPTANGILSSTVDTSTLLDDPDDDLNISPTAAVCSACHDSDIAKAHMKVPGGAVFDQTQGVITSTIVETCSVCHGPGRDADVEKVHAAR